jgi:hypothetical protein
MGRPERPVDRTVPQLAALADFLREQRQKAGLTYKQLSEETAASAATLKRAASGKSLPRQWVVEQYLGACHRLSGEDRKDPWGILPAAAAAHGERLWKQARHAVLVPQRAYAAPCPQYVRDKADLSGALRDLHAWAGSPPVRLMEDRAGGFGALPHSTAHRIIRGKALPTSEKQMVAFLDACEIPESKYADWMAAWLKGKEVPPAEHYELGDIQTRFDRLFRFDPTPEFMHAVADLARTSC